MVVQGQFRKWEREGGGREKGGGRGEGGEGGGGRGEYECVWREGGRVCGEGGMEE